MLKHEMGKEASTEKDDDKEGERDFEYPHVHKVLNMIFPDVESKSRLKVINREVNLVVPATVKYLNWTKTPVTFDQSDHPSYIATPGR